MPENPLESPQLETPEEQEEAINNEAAAGNNEEEIPEGNEGNSQIENYDLASMLVAFQGQPTEQIEDQAWEDLHQTMQSLAGGGVFPAPIPQSIQQGKFVAKRVARAALLLGLLGVSAVAMSTVDSFMPTGADYNLIPEAIVGGIPIFNVKEIERGMSDRILKYRAIGNVFLAHQKGGVDTLRLSGIFSGPYRYMYLGMMLHLQQTSEGTLEDLVQGAGTGTPPSGMSETVEYDEESESVTYRSHFTYPVITHTDIILNMYVQTVEWSQKKDEGGNKVVHYNLLFRKHVEPESYKIFTKDGKKRAYLNYDAASAKSRRRLEFALNVIWKLRSINEEIFRNGLLDGKSGPEWNKEAVFADPYIGEITALSQGAVADSYW